MYLVTLGHFLASSAASAEVMRRQLLAPKPSASAIVAFLLPHHAGAPASGLPPASLDALLVGEPLLPHPAARAPVLLAPTPSKRRPATVRLTTMPTSAVIAMASGTVVGMPRTRPLAK